MKKPKWEDEFKEKFFYKTDDGFLPISTPDLIGMQKDFIRKLEAEAFCRGWSECESARADIKLDERRKLCDYLLEHGHGGGNFRRLIMEQRNKN
jgi:hypothetical protein